MRRRGSGSNAQAVITAIVGSPTRTNLVLAYAWRALGIDARILWPQEATELLREDDVALFRLDVLPSLDGIEPGLEVADELARRGVRVLNGADSMLAAHDKLLTAELLAAAGVPHPRVVHVDASTSESVRLPCVIKPRFGSWGQDVFLCRTQDELEATLRAVRVRSWFERHGALAQEVIGPVRSDLRLVVAGGTVVASGERMAALGEWRTNVSLGGSVRPVPPSQEARELAVRAADAIGIDLAGVDLLPTADGWIVLELNGAVDFDANYTLGDSDPFVAALTALQIGTPSPRHRSIERKDDVMTKNLKASPPRPGDEIVITGHAVGDAPRTAVILEVLGDPGHERYHVRWEDGHESIYFPAGDSVVRRAARAQKTTA